MRADEAIKKVECSRVLAFGSRTAARADELMRWARRYISALDCSVSQASNALRSMRLWCGWYPGMLE